MNITAITHQGFHRNHNEDYVQYVYNQTNQLLMVACDGMGGHNAGEVASTIACNSLIESFKATNLITKDQAKEWLRVQINDVNELIFKRSQSNDDERGMGTTLCAAIVYHDEVWVANIGDTRAYMISQDKIHQLTYDHTFVGHLMRSGELTDDEARQHPQRNILTKSVGTSRLIYPDIMKYSTKYKDFILLCTDGLTDELTDDEIKSITNQSNDVHQAAEQLIELALNRGASDNLSIILLDLKAGDLE